MKIEITGEPKEIAALVLAVQERQSKAIVETTDWAGNVTVVTEKSARKIHSTTSITMKLNFPFFFSILQQNGDWHKEVNPMESKKPSEPLGKMSTTQYCSTPQQKLFLMESVEQDPVQFQPFENACCFLLMF